MKALLWIVVAAVCLLAGFVMGRQHRPPAVYADTVTYVDTQRVAYPVPRDSTVIRYLTVTLPAVPDTTEPAATVPDTCTVQLPITQKVYRDSNYTAWVSGFLPALDSLHLYPRTQIITRRFYERPPRWSVGVGAGYGITPKGMLPFLGVSVQFRLFH